MEFKFYESKPITRMAFQITKDFLLAKVENEESTYIISNDIRKPFIRFKAYEEPKVGDWIVRFTEEDTYHVTDTVFREKNIVPGIDFSDMT